VTDRALTPRQAVDRWLHHQARDKAAQTVQSYRYRLKHFVEFCESHEEIALINDLTTWHLDEFEAERGSEVAVSTLKNELSTLRNCLRYCSQLGLVAEEVAEFVEPPSVSPTRDERLAADRAASILQTYRSSEDRARRRHVVCELLWTTAARMGAVRGLDLRDVDTDDSTVTFRHRPDTGTPLKNGRDGERVVTITGTTATVLGEYVGAYRHERVEDGRRPLLTTTEGRISLGALREDCYHGWLRCRVEPCPHGREQDSCDYWRSVKQATHCPSSVSPHVVRAGSITWHRNQGWPVDDLSDRVNASAYIIEEHYDLAADRERLRERRRQHADKLAIDTDDDN
jgi:site-specific recombinase XerD